MATEKELLNLSGAILSAFETNHFLHELKKSPLVKQRARNLSNKAYEALKEIEITYYNEVEKVDEKDMQSKKIENRLDFTKWMLTKFDSNEVQKLKEVCVAYSLDPNRLGSISDKILEKHGAKKV